MTENELKTLVVGLARRNGWAVYHTSQSKPRRPVRNQGTADSAGYPDLTCARDGEVIWIELKQEKANPTADQIFWAEAIGRPCHLIRPRDWDSGRVGELLR